MRSVLILTALVLPGEAWAQLPAYSPYGGGCSGGGVSVGIQTYRPTLGGYGYSYSGIPSPFPGQYLGAPPAVYGAPALPYSSYPYGYGGGLPYYGGYGYPSPYSVCPNGQCYASYR